MKKRNRKEEKSNIVSSSFRDPSGSLFFKEGRLLRSVNISYKEHYDMASGAGLFKSLVRDALLIPHEEVALAAEGNADTYKTLAPEKISFVSYPYEWCFGQFKDAALTTLEIQKRALSFGMVLKDASAFNIQFHNGRPIFIDTLSFERYEEGSPWIAYRQFCQHFLAPLALMSHKDQRLSQLFRIFLDGIPLNLASSLLPLRTYFSPALLGHIHMHARGQEKFSHQKFTPSLRISLHGMRALIDNIEGAVRRLTIKSAGTEWGDYYGNTNYTEESFGRKKEVVSRFLRRTNSHIVWDLGANMGEFSRIASDMGIQTIALDNDIEAVEKNYGIVVQKKEKNLLPLLCDLTNPSPNVGWDNAERDSLSKRGPADTVLALALVHHLAITNNTPLAMVAAYLRTVCRNLIIEFVPKTDSQVKRLLATRKDIFPNYHEKAFEKEFEKYFTIVAKETVGAARCLYLMIKK